MATTAFPIQAIRAVLVGCNGWVSGERYELPEGQPMIIGRSRSCDISLRRVGGYLNQPANDRDIDHDFNTVSRRHVRLVVENGVANVEDLSTNGTYFNNIQASGPIELDLRESSLLIRLGTRETFRLEIENITNSAQTA